MKALILAAGLGKRLGLKDVPKPMCIIAGKPILEHNILLLKKHFVEDICINLHFLPDVIKSYFADGGKWGVKIQYSFEKELLGTSGSIKNIERFWNKEPFFVIYGDNYTNVDLTSMLHEHNLFKPLVTIALFDPKKVKNSGIFGGFVTMNKNNRLLSFIEGKKDMPSSYVNAGVYILEPEVLDLIPGDRASDFGSDIFPTLIEKGYLINGYETSDIVIAFDTLEALEYGRKIMSIIGGN